MADKGSFLCKDCIYIKSPSDGPYHDLSVCSHPMMLSQVTGEAYFSCHRVKQRCNNNGWYLPMSEG